MNYATAFEPRLSTSDPPSNDWDRLPWLRDERSTVRRRPNAALVICAIGLATADAACSYSLGKLSVRRGWMETWFQNPIAQAPLAEPPEPKDAQTLAARMSKAESIGWQLRRPNAPY
jgi:hypothetical protein